MEKVVENKLFLGPGDYYVHSFGLKIENTNGTNWIEVELPYSLKTGPIEVNLEELKENETKEED